MDRKRSFFRSENLRGKLKLRLTLILVLIILGNVLISPGQLTARGATNSVVPARAPAVNTDRIIHIKFLDGINLDKPADLLPVNLKSSIDRIEPLFTLPVKELDQLKLRGEAQLMEMGAEYSPAPDLLLPDLKSWYQVFLKPNIDQESMIDQLQMVPTVEVVEPAPIPVPLPVDTPDFTSLQGYLGAASAGIDSQYAWGFPGGNGTGVTIYDVEYSWNQVHEDLSKISGIAQLLNPGDIAIDPFASNHHGTAVLGEIIADNNAKGVTGISWGADVGLAPANTLFSFYNPANAILLAVADGSPGDVILIEQQYWVCGVDAYGPLEWIVSVYDAIQTAVANGFVVVEAAGNGNVDLDQTACGTTFNRGDNDSGAIIVGAGRPPSSGSDRERESFSSYGSRIDVQGWGSAVMTTGYGSYYTNSSDPANPNYWYTASFNGTSSASPIIAGAAANLQGISLNYFGMPLSPFKVRDLLVQTGSPQLGNTAEHIGPRPNLRDAIDTFLLNFDPVLDPVGDQLVAEGALLSFTTQANDPNVPPQSLTFSLDPGAPLGASIDPLSGNFSWTPDENQGPGTYPVTIRVTDNGVPSPSSDFETINVTVDEVNQSPILTPIGNKIVDEMEQVSFTATASDLDIPANTLTYNLDSGAPPGASIHPTTGEFTWTPSENQGPGVFAITIRVTDDHFPSPLDDFETIDFTINEVNQAPVLDSIGDKTVKELTALAFTATATDADLPPDTLSFSLDPGAPVGAAIDPISGIFSWTPTKDQSLAVYQITIRVTDDNLPPLSDSETINVTVVQPTFLPMLMK